MMIIELYKLLLMLSMVLDIIGFLRDHIRDFTLYHFLQTLQSTPTQSMSWTTMNRLAVDEHGEQSTISSD